MRRLYGLGQTAIILFATLLPAGCGPQPAAGPTSGQTPAAGQTSTAGPTPFREFWEEQYVKGVKTGHTHGSYFHDVLDGEPVYRIERVGTMSLKRAGQTIDQTMHEVSWETPAGEVRKFRNSMIVGGAAQTTTGEVRNGRARLRLETSGSATETTVDWPAGTLGGLGIDDWLLRTRPQPGMTAKLSAFFPVINQIVQFTVVAKSKEVVDVGGRREELLRVEVQAELPGGIKLDSVAWVDDQGEGRKSEMPAMEHMTLRTTREQALRPGVATAAVDIDAVTKVSVTPPLTKPYETTAVRYRVTLAGGDAAALFPSGDSQLVTRRDDGTAEVLVVALRPDSAKASASASAPPTDADRSPNSWIQSDDPQIVRLAAAAAGAETDPWRTAVALEASLQPNWTERGDSFATASDAARNMAGDCTEKGVLLAAMLRARGIPSRTAFGLVYKDDAFRFHMWTEAYIGDRWIPLDAGWRRGGTSAAYLKIAHTNLAGVDPLATLISVAQVMGRLKVEVLERK